MHARLVTSVALLVLTTGCSGDTGERAPTPPAPRSTAAAEPGTGREEACRRFTAIVVDVTLSDTESAARFRALASSTTDARLREAIQRVAEGFARHDPQISSSEVQALCR
jgi:hypothetical protein